MMRLTRKGFTLVEIMIVVAIIALLAAIAIPNLLRARLNANETAAIGTCRTYSSALQSFFAANPNTGYPLTAVGFTALAPAGVPPYVDATLAVAAPTRQGYGYTYAGVAAVGGVTSGYHIYAAPSIITTTGVREFYIDEQGVVYATPTGAVALVGNPGHAGAGGDPDGAALVWQPIQ